MDAESLDFDAVILAGAVPRVLAVCPSRLDVRRRHPVAPFGRRSRGCPGRGGGGSRRRGTCRPASSACREEPAFSGPAAAIAAGLAAAGRTRRTPFRFTLVLACDMPKSRRRCRPWQMRCSSMNGRREFQQQPDGVVAVSEDGRLQPLAGFYSTAALQRSVADLAGKGSLINGSVMALLASLDVQPVAVPAGSTADVDTWDDAAALGVAGRDPSAGSGATRPQMIWEAKREKPGRDPGRVVPGAAAGI